MIPLPLVLVSTRKEKGGGGDGPQQRQRDLHGSADVPIRSVMLHNDLQERLLAAREDPVVGIIEVKKEH